MNRITHYQDAGDRHRIHTKKRVLPSIPFAIAVLGAPGSGKSTVVTDLVLRDDMYRPYFRGKDIYIFNPNYTTDDKYKLITERKKIPDGIVVPDNNVYTKWNPAQFMELVNDLQHEHAEKVSQGKINSPKLIIIDDFGEKLRKKVDFMINGVLESIVPLDYLIKSRRHCNVSILLCLHQMKQISPLARSSLTGWFIIGLDNAELESFTREYGYGDRKAFKQYFVTAMEIPHNFILMTRDPDRGSLPKFYSSNFTPILMPTTEAVVDSVPRAESASRRRGKRQPIELHTQQV